MSSYEYWDINTGEGLSDNELYRRYEDMIDEAHDMVKVGVLEWFPSDVFKKMDPIGYRVGFNDWLDAELGETITDIDPESYPGMDDEE